MNEVAGGEVRQGEREDVLGLFLLISKGHHNYISPPLHSPLWSPWQITVSAHQATAGHRHAGAAVLQTGKNLIILLIKLSTIMPGSKNCGATPACPAPTFSSQANI